MFTDTHCHLTAETLLMHLSTVLGRAREAGVSGYIVPATQPNDWQAVLSLKQQFGVRVVALGVHPWFAKQASTISMNQLENILISDSSIWVGEIGLDALFNASKSFQLSVFEQQVVLAKQYNRPIILHNLRSTTDMLSVIKRVKFDCGGIVHAFSGSLEEADLWIRLGFKIGIGSLLLNPNAKKARRAAMMLPIESLLLETDSPYMLPNESNLPENTAKIARIIAHLRGISLVNLATQLEHNLLDLRV